MTDIPGILIVDDELEFLERVKRNIKQYEAVTSSTVPDALQQISNGGISLIVADMKLRGQERGYDLFAELFRNGEAIPVILMTGYDLTDADVRHFKSLGAIEILPKAGERDPLSKVIERMAQNIIGDENNRFVLFEKRIWQDDLQDNNMEHEGSTKTISEWLAISKTPAISKDERTTILKKAASVCNRYKRHDDDMDYEFPHF